MIKHKLSKIFVAAAIMFAVIFTTGCKNGPDEPDDPGTTKNSEDGGGTKSDPNSEDGGDSGNNSTSKTPEVPQLAAGVGIQVSDVTAATVVKAMQFGWNLGNTLDANDEGDSWSKDYGEEEIDWGLKNTASTALFKKLKDSGLKCVRIPISWHNHVDKNLTIDTAWLNHVQEVVNMAYSQGLYVIINIHHDNYKSTGLGSKAGFTLYDEDIDQSKKFVTKIWSQVGERFKDYDAHLVFETINEPRICGDSHEWGCTSTTDLWNCSTCQSAFNNINKINQAALDAIRDAGGNNTNRVVMFPGYVAAPYAAINGHKNGTFKVPTDSATDRLALSVHMYTPYDFAMNPTGHSDFLESDMTSLYYDFVNLNAEFVSKGIPVVVGEMGATNRNNFEARKSWFSYYLGLCNAYDMAALLWDNGNETNADEPAEAFGFMNRKASSPDWFTTSKASELIAAGVASINADTSVLFTGSQDVKHWTGADAITLDAYKFAKATDSSYLELTIKVGAECTESGCTDNESKVWPITAWNNGSITFTTGSNATINDEKQLVVTNAVANGATAVVTIKPDSASWATIKQKGLILSGHKVIITKVELK